MFSIELKKLRESRGLSQSKLAQQLGVSQATVGMWESGKREPSFPVLRTLCEFFCVSADQFLGLPYTVPSQCVVDPHVSDDELSILNKIRALTPRDRSVLLSTLDTLYQTSGGEKRNSITNAV